MRPQQIVSVEPRVLRRGWSTIPALARTISDLIDRHGWNEAVLCERVAGALERVIDDLDWLPGALRHPARNSYRRELLHEAADGRFSIGCFIWGPGQQTPIHDHRSWGVMGVAIGAVQSVSFYPVQSGMLVPGPVEEVVAGQCAWVHPEGGDIHRVGAGEDEPAVSIHVYGSRFNRVCRNRYHADGTVLTR
jgi:predicted metal-dependent enzyme (double-stranded beta helix superfamily)